ncbi:protein phosphatase 1 regulatory subunit 1A isoform X1 [Malaclemys terrapin pileata]|uniref:Protein phosphatase 1 regulatory subunit 1A n=1 Tax=Chrysemys picta bellii TaxID=8478 RepID=A0A8C3FZ36_CHRPI|nr:protein phosphatase 1 regulatory subunit 1A isoform X1 [Chrysemys picta bellii]XP_053869184.1 protein phosphatase 1 regulatory subunit 1A isoform X1 [Malaclemys terrapin pileata]
MEPNSPRKIQFTVPLLEPHLDPEAAEQIRRRRPTPATLVLSSDQSSPEIDEDRLPNPLLKPGLSMSPRQRKKVPRTTPTMKELQMMVEHHLCKQQAEEEDASLGSQEPHSPGCCHHGNTDPSHSPGGTCPLAQAKTRLESQEGNHAGPDGKEESTGACAKSEDNGRPGLSSEKQHVHILPKDSSGKQAPASD